MDPLPELCCQISKRYQAKINKKNFAQKDPAKFPQMAEQRVEFRRTSARERWRLEARKAPNAWLHLTQISFNFSPCFCHILLQRKSDTEFYGGGGGNTYTFVLA